LLPLHFATDICNVQEPVSYRPFLSVAKLTVCETRRRWGAFGGHFYSVMRCSEPARRLAIVKSRAKSCRGRASSCAKRAMTVGSPEYFESLCLGRWSRHHHWHQNHGQRQREFECLACLRLHDSINLLMDFCCFFCCQLSHCNLASSGLTRSIGAPGRGPAIRVAEVQLPRRRPQSHLTVSIPRCLRCGRRDHRTRRSFG
jgi:hypothetical protein